MILSRRAPSSLNMSSYRAIWTHFNQMSYSLNKTYQILVPKSWFWIHKIVLTGGLPAPQTLWRGAGSPPCPSAYREAPPLGLSVDLGTKVHDEFPGSRWAPRFMMGSGKK